MSERTKETEVLAKAVRRRFTAEEKCRILKEAAACTKRGELGALLRREGIYSSHLSKWREGIKKSELKSLAPKKRGPVPKVPDRRDHQLIEAAQEIARWQKRAERAEAIVDFQKKVSEMLGICLPSRNENS